MTAARCAIAIIALVTVCLPTFGVAAKEKDFPSWWPRVKGDSRLFLPTSMKCPGGGDRGVLELESYKTAEYGYRMRVVYENRKPRSFTLAKFENGNFKDTLSKKLPAKGYKGPKKISNAILKNVCRGSDAAKKEFSDFLEANIDRLERQ